MKSKTLSLYFFSIGLLVNSAFCIAAPLTVKIDSSTKTYHKNIEFELTVTFHNTSDKPFIVFPAYIRRKYIALDGQNAQFNRYPGPVIDPWPTAIILNGGEIKTTKFTGMRNGDGIWSLEPGRYDLSVSLDVATTSTFGTTPDKYKDMDIWRGNAASEMIRINYLTEE